MRLAIILLLSSFCVGQNAAPTSIPVDSAPAVSTQATASVRAQDNIRHIADRVCFSGGATTAPSLTQLTVVLRDGATGAGTVLATFVIVVPASTGQNVAPFCADMGIQGSNNTAMTAEWSALLTNEFETVTLYYHNRTN